ncbi:MAG TPA: glycosyltransferase 87 family protein [Gaiellales bacterium]|nr:glycosyltransferase 87 family protein [Gaiellales bacterium]
MSLPTRIAASRPTPTDLIWVALLGIPAAMLAVFTVRAAFAFPDYRDFHIFWSAGRAVVDGTPVYPRAALAAVGRQNLFVYPAPAAIAMVPLALLPLGAAAAIFLALNAAALMLALRLLGVRDWRCYAIAFCSIATLQTLTLGAITSLLLLGAACAWRWRDRRSVAAPAVAAVIVAKLFLAPLLVWLWATGRRATALATAAIAAVAGLAGWALIGFSSLRGYPHLMSVVSAHEQRLGYSVAALAAHLGAGAGAARMLTVLAAAALSGLALLLARGPDGDRRAFSVAVVAALALSPIVWLNYLLLGLAPLALARPRLSRAWALPLLAWIFANPNTLAPLWKVVLFHATLAAILAVAVLGRDQRTSPGTP